MKKTKLMTIIVCSVILIGAIIYDIFMATNGISDDTISEVYRDFAYVTNILVYALGVISSHLVWHDKTRKRKHLKPKYIIIILLSVAAALSIIGLFYPIDLLLVFFIGFVLGKIFFFQYKEK